MTTQPAPPPAEPAPRPEGTAREVLWAFLRLGLTSFGGPVAHLGFFREALVVRRGWLSDRAYADVVALCQFLPGPASSQVGMAIGLHRAGMRGLLAAWLAFTLPSAVLLTVFALTLGALGDLGGAGWLLGLKAAAAAVVAQAVMGMARSLAPDAPRASIAAAGMILLVLLPGTLVQLGVIAGGAVAGLMLLRPEAEHDGTDDALRTGIPRRLAVGALIAFGALLIALPLLAALTGDRALGLADVFYRAGALVFGGGHVVLPLLEAETLRTGLVGHDHFLAGYGAAQAVPGPLFTFSAFLGASTTSGPSGLLGAGIALVAIFLPSGLLVVGALPFWSRLRHAPRARRALAGVNAAVVGILAAALYDPVLTSGVTSPGTLCTAVAAFVALTAWKAPPWAVVIGAAVLGAAVL